ncbi:centrosome and spindle pole-associated protein 1 [Cottoperca gobio]|uniref:Centrosome and spindle pole-associated protein 1 n=1 Tax=Cottoperca gobio TaxID=56716 RepID=A0A6J2RT12_COTGO|nr:centrosome and spindle pole-associated protein 1 [Cottoperca gobio]
MPSASAAQRISPNPDRGLGLSFLLGSDYERKKKKLQLELQLDYKHYAAKKKDLKTEPRPQPQGLSLPIDEKISVQERLREERRKEYNLFLQEKAQMGRWKRGTPPVTSTPGQVQASDVLHNISSPASPPPVLHTCTNTQPPPRERPASRRDAATLTDAVDNGNSSRTRGPGTRGRRRWQLQRQKEPLYIYSSEEEPITDLEDELEFRHRRRRDRHTPEYKEERRTRKRRANRAPPDQREAEAPDVQHHNNEWKSDLQMSESSKTTAASRAATSKDPAQCATGLMIGTADEQTASQARKEQYKTELLKQIAEQQRNKIREKKLGVAATGAADPERQFRAGNRPFDGWRRDVLHKPGVDLQAVGKEPNPKSRDDKHTEDAEQRGRSHVGYRAALSQLTGSRTRRDVPSLDYFNEDYHRDFSNVLGEVANLRVPGVPAPAPPTGTPQDAAYYNYRTRTPSNLNDLPGGVQLSGNFYSPPQRPPPPRPSRRTEATDHRPPLDVGELPADKLMRERALSYQEALRQQITERQEHKRKEKEEKERYDAKMEAEMMAFNPWGRSGGGAPIKDQKGNLVSDLNQMYRTNKESYRNPASGNNGQTQSFLMRDGDTPAPLSHRITGFNTQPTPQQLHMQDKYKEDLKQQMEENKQKQTKAAEKTRIEEEKEERRLADQRACILREYEEEQSKQKKIQQRLKNKDRVLEVNTEHKEEKKRREQDVEEKVPERDGEETKTQMTYERAPSPPVPTLQRKQTNVEASRPPSVESQLSARTELSVSAPHSRLVPAEIPQLQDSQQEVMRGLSALRRYLRNEQKQLEAQLGKIDRQEPHYTPPNRPRGRPRVDAFESTHKQPSTRSSSSAAARVNMQHMSEFNHLKCRDSASREEVRLLYPDPPTDTHSLDIQQQVLLRQQQRTLRLMKREEEPDILQQQPSHSRSRNKPGRFLHRDNILPSETDFIGKTDPLFFYFLHEESVYISGEQYAQDIFHKGDMPWEFSSLVTFLILQHETHENLFLLLVSTDQRSRDLRTDVQSLQSETSLNLDSEVRAHTQHFGDDTGRADWPSADEADVSSPRSALDRRVSMDTVATEAWLRPGTADSVSRSSCRERTEAPPRLTHR